MGKFDRILSGKEKLRGLKKHNVGLPACHLTSLPMCVHHFPPSSTRLNARRWGEERQYDLYQTDC